MLHYPFAPAASDKPRPYQWNAQDYAQSSSGQQQWGRELIVKLQLRGPEHLLDIGCGDGKITVEIAGQLPRGVVIGVDNSPEMIALARKSFETPAHANLHFQLADAFCLPFEDEFDVIFSNATLHWLLDHRPVLQGCHRALRRAGKILLQMGGRGNAAAVIAVLDEVRAAPEWREYFADFTFPYGFYAPETYRGWLAEAGLTARRVELLPKTLRHADCAAFTGWFRTTWLPYTQRVPEARRPAFIAQVVETYLAQNPPDETGAVQVQMIRLEVEAAK